MAPKAAHWAGHRLLRAFPHFRRKATFLTATWDEYSFTEIVGSTGPSQFPFHRLITQKKGKKERAVYKGKKERLEATVKECKEVNEQGSGPGDLSFFLFRLQGLRFEQGLESIHVNWDLRLNWCLSSFPWILRKMLPFYQRLSLSGSPRVDSKANFQSSPIFLWSSTFEWNSWSVLSSGHIPT